MALLCYLAVTARPRSRETLIGLLWPEATEANARASLRKALVDLRRGLAPYLTVTRHEVAFDQDAPYWPDVEAFEANLADVSSACDVQRIKEAIDLYRGDVLERFYVRQAPAFEE